jgi:predicted SAM-dependent methyltransferase
MRLFRRKKRKLDGHASETSMCRERLAPFCTGYGLDLGFGGDAIAPHSIRMDMIAPYSHVGHESVQLGGDATSLYWFKDGVLDFIYSSHLLEDFPDTGAVLREWWRCLKPGGRLVIFCPDEQAYRKHCASQGVSSNPHHSHENFSLAQVKEVLDGIGSYKVLHETPLVDIYSWDLVAEKL